MIDHHNTLITCAGSEIGIAIAKILAQSNNHLILVDEKYPPTYDKFIQELTNLNIPHLVLEIDLAETNERQWLHTEIAATFGELHGMVFLCPNSFSSDPPITSAVIDSIMQQCIKIPTQLTQELSSLFVDPSSIVLLTPPVNTVSHQAAYALCERSIHSAMQILLNELGPEIRVNTISSNNIQSTPTKDAKPVPKIPLNRYGTPREVAYVVDYLLSSKSSYINNQVVKVNGGSDSSE